VKSRSTQVHLRKTTTCLFCELGPDAFKTTFPEETKVTLLKMKEDKQEDELC
jgi:hypothetical protein